MHTIIIAIIIVAVVGLFIWVLVSIHNRETGKTAADLLRRFDEAAQKVNLRVSKKEVLGNVIIGLDDVYKELIIFKKREDEYHSLVINLNDVKGCSKRKVYHSIDMDGGRKGKYESHVGEILLSLDIPHQPEQENIAFYDSRVYGLRDLEEAERKANEWETTIRKILLTTDQKKGMTRVW